MNDYFIREEVALVSGRTKPCPRDVNSPVAIVSLARPHEQPRRVHRVGAFRSMWLTLVVINALFALIPLSPPWTPPFAAAVRYHLRHEIRRRQVQCIHSKFTIGEFATFSMFVLDALNNGDLAAVVQCEGPFAGEEVVTNATATYVPGDEGEEKDYDDRERQRDQRKRRRNGYVNGMGSQLQEGLNNFPSFVQHNSRQMSQKGIIHQSFHVDFTHAGESEDAIAARADFHEKQRQEMEENEKRDMEAGFSPNRMINVMMDTVRPFEYTRPIRTPGWYRMCVQADKFTLIVEMDIRSGSELGGIDPETRQVYTHDKREELDMQQRILGGEDDSKQEEQDANSLELEKNLQDQVRDYDLKKTKKQMQEINSLVSNLQRRQQDSHYRIKNHEGNAKRNYERIVMSGAIETVLYVLITGFQVYTVQRWLRSGSLLG